MTRCLLRVWTIAAIAGSSGFISVPADKAAAKETAATIQPAQTVSSGQSTNSGPRIEFSELNYDFGKVGPGQTVTHTFVFTNLGAEPLQIKEVRPSCSCTAAGNYSKRVEPGQSGIIPVIYSASGLSGPVGKNVWVASNDPTQPSVNLRISA